MHCHTIMEEKSHISTVIECESHIGKAIHGEASCRSDGTRRAE